MMSTAITLYGIPNCDTVKKSRAWFDQASIAYQFHDFKKQGLPPADLQRWVQVLGWEALVNKKGTTWRGLDAAAQASVVDSVSAVALMLAHSSLIKRPIVTNGEHVTAGFAPQAWEKML
jgi:arsenate reductase (glutaredoxin)